MMPHAYRKPMPRCPLSGKRPYPDEVLAAAHAAGIGTKHKIKLYVYRCPHCNMWHLTKSAPRLKGK